MRCAAYIDAENSSVKRLAEPSASSFANAYLVDELRSHGQIDSHWYHVKLYSRIHDDCKEDVDHYENHHHRKRIVEN